mmetsp:Transcript_30974/g.68007  ORF Transcript_30974/g.68007 Transcript_30974/m.68007 type:complete len:196 (+) Transcript_30974:63-650(+)
MGGLFSSAEEPPVEPNWIGETKSALNDALLEPISETDLAHPSVEVLHKVFLDLQGRTGSGAGLFEEEELRNVVDPMNSEVRDIFVKKVVDFVTTAADTELPSCAASAFTSEADPEMACRVLCLLARVASDDECKQRWTISVKYAKAMSGVRLRNAQIALLQGELRAAHEGDVWHGSADVEEEEEEEEAPRKRRAR